MEQVAWLAWLALLMLAVPLRYVLPHSQHSYVAKLLRWFFVRFLITVLIACGIIFTVSALAFKSFFISGTPGIATHCTILSSGVDLRITKTCSSQLHIYSADTTGAHSKFRCYFEYYWASFFQVELNPYMSKLPLQAIAQIPREALPAHCRPGFGTVWTLKGKYQVNGSYPCKYIPGKFGTVEFMEEFFPHCKAEELTLLNLIKQAVTISFDDQWMLPSTNQAGYAFWKTLASMSIGIGYSMMVAGFARGVRYLWLRRNGSNRAFNSMYFEFGHYLSIQREPDFFLLCLVELFTI